MDFIAFFIKKHGKKTLAISGETQAYTGKKQQILILAFLADYKSGEIKLNEHQAVEWVDIADLEKYDFLEADKKIVGDLVGVKK